MNDWQPKINEPVRVIGVKGPCRVLSGVVKSCKKLQVGDQDGQLLIVHAHRLRPLAEAEGAGSSGLVSDTDRIEALERRIASLEKPARDAEVRFDIKLTVGDDGKVVAEVPAMPGCVSQGDTIDDAIRNAREAAELWVESQECMVSAFLSSGLAADDYQTKAMATAKGPALAPPIDRLVYGVTKLNGEAGKVAEAFGKLVFRPLYRTDCGAFTGSRAVSEEAREAILEELGDVLWYAALIADACGSKLSSVMQRKLDKLAEQHEKDDAEGQ